MPPRDSLRNTFLVSTVLCIVCSLAVSAAAVALRPRQERNMILDRQRNILDATGLAMGEVGRPASELSLEQVKQLYERVEERLVDLETGEYVSDSDLEAHNMTVESYNARDAAKRPDMRVPVQDPDHKIGPLFREPYAQVFLVRHPRTKQVTQVVLPVYGRGLWSTLYGYLAVRRDLQTIQGLTFYEHGETPGLGGEVDNPRWKEQWVGLALYDEQGQPAAGVARGSAPSGNPHLVDGLSGATITANGVTNLVRYWIGPDGYQNYLRQLEAELQSPQGETDVQ